MVISRQRSAAAAAAASTSVSETSEKPSKVPKPQLEEWTTKEKLYLASLAIKHNNSWSSVARHMQSFAEKDRPDGWTNQKTCAAQFDKLMNELGADKRPKRNESSDGNSSSVIYKKMAEKRMNEIRERTKELRKLWLDVNKEIEDVKSGQKTTDVAPEAAVSSDQSDSSTPSPVIKVEPAAKTLRSDTTQTIPSQVKTPTAKVSAAADSLNASTSSTSSTTTSEKPPTRALTRRESSRQNLEKTLSVLCKEASEIKAINLFCKPANPADRELYDKLVHKHIDMTIIKRRLGGEVDDPYAVMNDLMLMFQNMIMFYPPEHNIHKSAVEVREKLVIQWEKALLDRFKARH